MLGKLWIVFALLPIVMSIEWPPDSEVCEDVICSKPRGSWCTPQQKRNKVKAVCECPENCLDVYQPVCSVYGKQYDNLCKLHEYACKRGKNIEFANNGECIASQQPCDEEELEEFPIRLLDWFLHLNEINEFGRLDPTNNIRDTTPEERVKFATWKFNLLDEGHDGKLDRRDMQNFRYSLMPLEHCADIFFKTCAGKKSKSITLDEWLDCLKVHDTEVYPPDGEEGIFEDEDNNDEE